jgi:hypothetical protein
MTSSLIAGRLRRHLAVAAAATTVTTGVSLAPATNAHAAWWFSKEYAMRAARDSASKRYGSSMSDLHARCRPQGEPFNSGFIYHSWVCTWVDTSDRSYGQLLIKGSRHKDSYYSDVLRGKRYL